MRTLCIAACLCLFSSIASAQEPSAMAEEMPTQVYIFGTAVIDGQTLRPDGMMSAARGNAGFGSLVTMHRSFMGEIQDATDESALD